MGRNKKHKGSRKHNRELKQHIVEEILHYQEYSLTDSRTLAKVCVKAKTKNQKFYIKKLKNNNVKIVVVVGPAGTGKSLLASQIGIEYFMKGRFDRIVITRPVMPVDEDIGYLPGSLEDKMAPWMSPIYDIFNKYMYQSDIKSLVEEKTIEICPLAFMRGRTFEKCWIIADEMQNATVNQIKMLMTRIGEGSKLVVTGDLKQVDRKDGNLGLQDFLKRVKNKTPKLIDYQELTMDDIVRCAVVKEVLELYDN